MTEKRDIDKARPTDKSNKIKIYCLNFTWMAFHDTLLNLSQIVTVKKVSVQNQPSLEFQTSEKILYRYYETESERDHNFEEIKKQLVK